MKTQEAEAQNSESLNLTNPKYELLKELEELEQKNKNIDVNFLLMMLLMLFFLVSLFAPKIYLREQIYLKSREINKLSSQLDSLIEENKALRQQLEDTKFKYLIMDLGN